MSILAKISTSAGGLRRLGVETEAVATDIWNDPHSGWIKENQMPAFVISDVSIKDAEAVETYRTRAAASIAQHGGRYLVRGGKVECLEGGWTPNLIVVEFPDMERARAWYRSPEYASALEVRDAAIGRNLILIDGVAPPRSPRRVDHAHSCESADVDQAVSGYGSRMRNPCPLILRAVLAAIAGLILLASGPLAAAEKSPTATGLPGVEGTYRIVKPTPPEPEPDDAAPAAGQYGRWDVTISGKLTVDIGAGNLPPPRH